MTSKEKLIEVRNQLLLSKQMMEEIDLYEDGHPAVNDFTKELKNAENSLENLDSGIKESMDDANDLENKATDVQNNLEGLARQVLESQNSIGELFHRMDFLKEQLGKDSDKLGQVYDMVEKTILQIDAIFMEVFPESPSKQITKSQIFRTLLQERYSWIDIDQTENPDAFIDWLLENNDSIEDAVEECRWLMEQINPKKAEEK